MMRRCADFSVWCWRSVSLSWWHNHICWRHLEFGLFLYPLHDFSSGRSSVSVLVTDLVSAIVVVCPSWGGSLLVDDSWGFSSRVLVKLYDRRCLVSCIFLAGVVLLLAELVPCL